MMWMDVVCLNLEIISKLVSWRIGSWKKDKKALASDLKVVWHPDFSSTYHLADGPISVLWKNFNQMESSMMILEEHHRWKEIMWLVGSSVGFPPNFGMSKGNLVGMLGQVGSCKIGSFVSLVKYGMLRDAKYGKFGSGAAMVCIG
jgi:hypothetical protein